MKMSAYLQYHAFLEHFYLKLAGQILIGPTNRRIDEPGVKEEEGKVYICNLGPTFPDQFQLYCLQ